MNEVIIEKIKDKIMNSIPLQPILFLSPSPEISIQEIKNLCYTLFESTHGDKNNIFILSDNGEKIKTSQMRDFIQKSNIKPSFWFQIFLIENISRATIESLNSALKFFEEPWVWNIIFLTNKDESGILETILSRVQIIQLKNNTNSPHSDFFFQMIQNYFFWKKDILIKYFFQDKKIEKQDYISFFQTFIYFIQKYPEYSFLGESIVNSLQYIEKNNVIPKYEIDKLLLKI